MFYNSSPNTCGQLLNFSLKILIDRFTSSTEMSVSKAAGLIVVVLLLVTISFTHLEEEEWGKLVSALFTGVDILDNHGRLLVEGTILQEFWLLTIKTLESTSGKTIPPTSIFPTLLLHLERHLKVVPISRVCFSAAKEHMQKRKSSRVFLQDITCTVSQLTTHHVVNVCRGWADLPICPLIQDR